MTVGNREVLVCHLPYHGDSGETERYAKFRPVAEEVIARLMDGTLRASA